MDEVDRRGRSPTSGLPCVFSYVEGPQDEIDGIKRCSVDLPTGEHFADSEGYCVSPCEVLLYLEGHHRPPSGVPDWYHDGPCRCESSPPGFVAQDGIHCGGCGGVVKPPTDTSACPDCGRVNLGKVTCLCKSKPPAEEPDKYMKDLAQTEGEPARILEPVLDGDTPPAEEPDPDPDHCSCGEPDCPDYVAPAEEPNDPDYRPGHPDHNRQPDDMDLYRGV